MTTEDYKLAFEVLSKVFELSLVVATVLLYLATKKLADDAQSASNNQLDETKKIAADAQSASNKQLELTKKNSDDALAVSTKLVEESKRSADAATQSAKEAAEARAQVHQIHLDEKALSQRQLLVQIWQYMMEMEQVKPDDLVQPDVKKAVDRLELVALCCEGGMVDELVIKRTFREIFMRQYEAVESCGSMEYFNGKDGKAVLAENAATQTFYEKLKKEHLERDKLKTL